MCYLDGYIMVIKLPGWSRAFYRDISNQITHGYFVLGIYQKFESFQTRPSTYVDIDTQLFERLACFL